jgi:RNA polymerase sigma factor (sigma-70 family)
VATGIEQGFAPSECVQPAELERLFRDHNQRVLKAAYRITGSMSDAEDVAQVVFANPESYLYRAAINAALDLLRKRNRESAVPLDEILPERPYAGPESHCEAGEIRKWLRQALAALAPRAAEMFVLRYVEGYDLGEVARMLNTSRAVVAVILHRTRTRLRNEYRTYMRGAR